MQGGNFWTGFASGAISSLVSSAWGGGKMEKSNTAWKGLGGNWGHSDFGTIAFGTVSGGAGAALTGGNFWQGAATGLTVSLLNHAMHEMGNDGDPPVKKGKLTFSEAKILYNFGNGLPVEVDLSTLDLSKVSMTDFGENNLAYIQLDGKHYSNTDDALVHGTITLERIGKTNEVRVAYNSKLNGRGGMYDFEMHKWSSARSIFMRNPATAAGFIINSFRIIAPGQISYAGGKSYPIFYSGTVKINK
ncbi:MAG TPA: hypothetical protein VFR70_07705 [Flavobacterium sp.]|nr:hypothetical protein [Flavobacterium sp.]